MILDRRSSDDKYAVVGDIHGCYFTLTERLLPALGFSLDGTHPDGMRLVSVGDLHDRGGTFGVEAGDPEISGAILCLKWGMEWTQKGVLDVVDSNHGQKLARKLMSGQREDKGNPFGHGLDDTLADIDNHPQTEALKTELIDFLSSRPTLARYSGGPSGEILVAHAAARPWMLSEGEVKKKAKGFCLFTRDFTWRGSQTLVVGHRVVLSPTRERASEEYGELIRIDTGAGEGKTLTAYLPFVDQFVTVEVDPRDLPSFERNERNRFKD